MNGKGNFTDDDEHRHEWIWTFSGKHAQGLRPIITQLAILLLYSLAIRTAITPAKWPININIHMHAALISWNFQIPSDLLIMRYSYSQWPYHTGFHALVILSTIILEPELQYLMLNILYCCCIKNCEHFCSRYTYNITSGTINSSTP